LLKGESEDGKPGHARCDDLTDEEQTLEACLPVSADPRKGSSAYAAMSLQAERDKVRDMQANGSRLSVSGERMQQVTRNGCGAVVWSFAKQGKQARCENRDAA